MVACFGHGLLWQELATGLYQIQAEDVPTFP